MRSRVIQTERALPRTLSSRRKRPSFSLYVASRYPYTPCLLAQRNVARWRETTGVGQQPSPVGLELYPSDYTNATGASETDQSLP
jgi:hypothetical protein